MLAIAANSRIFFFQNAVDMRKGVETLGCLWAHYNPMS
jgi:hypothetical protein